MRLLDSMQNLVLAHPVARQAAMAALLRYRKLLHSAKGSFARNPQPEHLARYNANRRLGPRKHLCYAPLSNLYFGTTGSITACCFNRQHVLGVYPRQTIRQAWEGEQAQALRDALAQGDFSLGCQGCEALIHSGNYASVNAQTYDYFERSGPGWPSRMDFELSNTCNLACVMCNGFCSSTIRKEVEKAPPLRAPYDDAFLSELQDFLPHLRYAKFLGGEPFLIPLYYRIWDALAERNPACQLYVQTNATRWDDRIAATLDRGLFSIGISLDSLNKERLEQIRVHANFEAVQANIHRFAAYCRSRGTRLSLSVCPMRWNLEELPALVAYANSLQASLYFNVVYEPHYAAVWNLPSAEIGHWIERLSNAEVPAPDIMGVLNRGVFLDFVRQLQAWKGEAEARERLLVAQLGVPLSELREQVGAACLDNLRREGAVEGSVFLQQFLRVEGWPETMQRSFLTYPPERIINALQVGHQSSPLIN